MESFDAKIRKVGSSLGVLIPKNIVEELNVDENSKVKVLLTKTNPEAIKKLLGLAEGSRGFHREHEEREF